MKKSPFAQIADKAVIAIKINEEITPVEIDNQVAYEAPEAPLTALENAQRLYNIKDPKTGKRYDIPLLDRNATDYFTQYIAKMEILERNPESFKKLMEWN